MIVEQTPLVTLAIALVVGGVIGRVLTICTPWLLREIEGEADVSSRTSSPAHTTSSPIAASLWAAACCRGWIAPVPVACWFAKRRRLAGWRTCLAVEVASLVVAGGLWLWEVRWGMQLSASSADTTISQGSLVVRLLAHLMLFGFLAAASWCDMRRRVIPDSITVPGVLLGLLAVACRPEVLLPVTHLVPRDYAVALSAPDVLGFAGPLEGTTVGAWAAATGGWIGLAAAVIGMAAWWSVGTAADPARRWYRDPRLIVLVVATASLVGLWWWCGFNGDPRRPVAALSSIVGAVVAGGLVLATREAASRSLGREAMGLGDATLMAMIGAWLGWQAGVLVFFIAVFLGLAHGMVGWLRHRESELAYGPSLCLAAVLLVLVWRWIWERVEPYFIAPGELAIVLAIVVILTGLSLAVLHRLRGGFGSS